MAERGYFFLPVFPYLLVLFDLVNEICITDAIFMKDFVLVFGIENLVENPQTCVQETLHLGNGHFPFSPADPHFCPFPVTLFQPVALLPVE
ncbi:hypothetical protein ES703_38531 [subsurface metagenome]